MAAKAWACAFILMLAIAVSVTGAPIAHAQANDLDCQDFDTQEEAQAVLDQDPSDPNNLDPNGDGIACALLPAAADLQQSADTGDAPAQQGNDNAQQRQNRRANRNQDNADNQNNGGNQDNGSIQAVEPSCSDYATAQEAQAAFDADPQGLAALDPDGDGIVCEELDQANTDNGQQNGRNNRRNQNNQQDQNTATVVDQPAQVRAKEDLDCIDFQFQEDAQAVYDADPSDPFNLDPNGDGFACSSLPSRTPRVSQVPRTGSGPSISLTDGVLPALALAGAVAAGAMLLRRCSWR